jgi:hypothetical protein
LIRGESVAQNTRVTRVARVARAQHIRNNDVGAFDVHVAVSGGLDSAVGKTRIPDGRLPGRCVVPGRNLQVVELPNIRASGSTHYERCAKPGQSP